MKLNRIAGALAALAITVAIPAAAQAAAEDAIGRWQDADTGGIAEIYSCDGGICIKVVTPGKGHEFDLHNPEQAIRGRPMAGAEIMYGAAQDGPDRWKGKIYNSEDGKTYAGYVTVKSKDEVRLEGCVLSFICKSHTWHRVK